MKRSIAILTLSAILLSSYMGLETPASASAATSTVTATASSTLQGSIVGGVNLRNKPSLSGSVVGFLKKGTAVQVLEKTNNYFYKIKTTEGTTGYISSSSKYLKVNGTVSQTVASGMNGTIVGGVNLRNKPSLSGSVVGFLKKGTSVQVLEKTNDYFYKIKTTEGTTGYISSSSKYLKVNGAVSEQPSNVNAGGSSTTSDKVNLVINTGKKYLGTPYEYGSNRNTTFTFDCSDFVRQAYKEALDITLPADSRKQGDWIKEQGTAVYNTSSLKAGDLVFFMSYKGSSASAYAGVNKSTERITHVAIYLGNNQLLHTYSSKSGGVRIDTLSNSWAHRFLFGGSVLK